MSTPQEREPPGAGVELIMDNRAGVAQPRGQLHGLRRGRIYHARHQIAVVVEVGEAHTCEPVAKLLHPLCTSPRRHDVMRLVARSWRVLPVGAQAAAPSPQLCQGRSALRSNGKVM
jgi:hypothetical protein